jgi:UDP-apiose/xylose synthase
MEALLRGKPLQLVDGGGSRRCFTYIDDAVDAVMAILGKPAKAKGEIFNIGHPGNEVSMSELAHAMVRLYRTLRPEFADTEFEIESVDAEAFYGAGYEDSDRRMPDISKAEDLLGWRPTTSLETALRQTMQSYIEEYGADCARREAC